MFQRYSFVAVTTKNLPKMKKFWTETLGFKIIEERRGSFCMIDAGGLRLCIDREDDERKAGSSDPIIGLKVSSLNNALSELSAKGIKPAKGPVNSSKGQWAIINDPDNRTIVLTEYD